MLKKGSRVFRPYYINECEDIKFAIKQVASQYNRDADSFDFELQAITTYKKNLYDYELEQIQQDVVDKFLQNRDNMLEPNLVISQRYCILIKEKERKETQFHLSTDKSFSEAFLYFHSGFTFKEGNFENLYARIKKEKVWNKILCFDEKSEKKALLDFLNTLSYPLKEETRYLLIRGVNLVVSTEAKLSFKKDITAQFQTVLANEVICEFQKPLQGKPGRNIRGDYIIPQAPKQEKQTSPLRYDSVSITLVDYPTKIEYRSAIGGLLDYNDDVLSIEDTLETQEVSFKTTGSLIGAIDSGAVINITEADAMKEALGQGMEIQAGEVNIEGNVGSDAIVHSKKVHIGGLTHQSSKIYADNVAVATHKGYIKGENVQIDMLEAGIVEGKRVEISKMYGGKIYAEEIVIHTLHSNAFLYATKSIHIVHMKKGENKFFLAADYSPSNKERYNALLAQKNNCIKEAIRLTKELKVESLELSKLKDTADEVRKVLMQYKNTKTKPPSYLLEKFEAYHARVVALREKREKINQLSGTFKSAREDIARLDVQTKDATISVDSGWVGYNEVHYTFYAPSRDFLCIPKPGEPSKVIYKDDKIELVL
ncbi:FapA family protein [Helicobacter turcicus]|uniref:FapA family protein n=1 Tax=Helicobacter turcicus TaxID=2867412 RepID=A0ABS7JLU6_9HELI|nr:FapA family protein [Helicobacter turcicus]MBX7490358.1 FapA family protein [Helicobacter turcicus]MBX7545063.1 FapA family protein [Helicobacter turcicus]